MDSQFYVVRQQECDIVHEKSTKTKSKKKTESKKQPETKKIFTYNPIRDGE